MNDKLNHKIYLNATTITNFTDYSKGVSVCHVATFVNLDDGSRELKHVVSDRLRFSQLTL
jgi:hypothetical protein